MACVPLGLARCFVARREMHTRSGWRAYQVHWGEESLLDELGLRGKVDFSWASANVLMHARLRGARGFPHAWRRFCGNSSDIQLRESCRANENSSLRAWNSWCYTYFGD